jgi:ABC-2 type transport system permease protein
MVRRFFHQSWLYFKGANRAFNFEEFALFQLLYPLATLVFYVMLAAYSFNTTNLTRWVVGNSFLLCVNIALFTLGQAFNSERYYGRLRSIIASPMSKLATILQKAVFPVLVAIVTVIIGFVAGSLIFDIPFMEINMGLMLVVIAVSMFAAIGLGLLMGALSLLTDSMHLVLNTMCYVLMVFCGANFPITQLPIWGQVFSRVLPLTRGIEAGNLLFEGFNQELFIRLMIGEFAIGAVFFTISYWVIKFAERAAIKRASLEMF